MSRRLIILILLAGTLRGLAAVDDEIRFVEGLTERGFPNLARTVLDRTLKQVPDAETAAPELRIRILIAERKFDEAQAQIPALKEDVGPLWLFLAETANSARQLPAAETAYQHYFETVTKADATVLQAAFNYGELLEDRGDTAAARALYEKVLGFPDIGKSARPVKARLARLLVSGEEPTPDERARAQKLCEEVQLGGLDLWFGQAVVTWSRVMQLNGEWDETASVLETQLELLKQLESGLEKQGQPVSLVSPLAGARYLLGLCYEHAGKKTEALTQFYNVYAKYGDSEWGPQAQEHAQALKDEFEAQGKTIKIDLGANLAKMEESRFRVARRLFFDKQYADAVPAYLTALNDYPEGDDAVTALRELIQSYISLSDPFFAKAVATYTGERFSARPAAADALLAAGKRALDTKQNDLAWWMYDQYLADFPQNPRAPAVLYSLAGLRSGEDQETYYTRILTEYPDSPYAARALG
ncbi:MAG: tetratricopeptide repeat protein, partial [Kiritimatiellales bacterium]